MTGKNSDIFHVIFFFFMEVYRQFASSWFCFWSKLPLDSLYWCVNTLFYPSRSSIYHSVEGPLTYVLNGELITEPRPLLPTLPPLPPHPLPSHTSQASFVSALAMEEESSVEVEKTAEPGPVTRQPHVMACYQSYLAQYQVKLWVIQW